MRLPFLSRNRHEAEVAAVRSEALESIARFTLTPRQATPNGAYAFDNPWSFVTPQSPRRKPTQLLDASTLRRLADSIDPLRSAIEHIKREVRATSVQVVPKDPKDRRAGSDATLARVTEAESYFKRVGGNGGFGTHRTSFEGQIIEDLLVIGAWAIYRDRLRGGGFQQYAIDAATILPRVDGFGWDAAKPFEQWIDGRKVREFRPGELVYDGVNPRSWTPYFVSPIEWLVSPLTSYAKMDEWNRTWLTDGNAPGDDVYVIGKGGEATQSAQSVQNFIRLWDAMRSGSAQERQKVAFLPDGSQKLNNGTRRDQDFQEFETQLIRRICSVFGVQPASIGYAGEQYKVSQEGSHDQTSRYGVGSVLLKRKELYDETLEELGYDDLEAIDVGDDEEDGLQQAQRLQVATGKPWMKRNEARAVQGMDPVPGWDDEDTAPEPDPVELAAATAKAKQGTMDDPKKAARAQWERVCLSRLSKGQSPAYDFRTEDIPQDERDAILTRLSDAHDEAAIRAAFQP
jgi:hypothetical protein